ncbi:DUF1801 domain-containing protein [Aliikangiella coralliicola]|uniref:DUF1801 domain-containing protein n=1 Tax=Aliikangiella coralliicola TaxID=2592383 RepID=A0A545U7H8_9GAMM|nr:DUF1801 domain-containing protein [Aliikangiella coralliicola]TQV85363.1 DUF1801 domain-containing protein [Aliikangiella coralliicola]
MSSLESEKVNQFIEDTQFQSPEKYEILVSLRKLIKQAGPHLIEGIKYGGLIYSCSNTLRCGIFVYKNHLSVEFGQGAEFLDPDKILEGKGKYRRHIKISEIDDIEKKKVGNFVKKAIELS